MKKIGYKLLTILLVSTIAFTGCKDKGVAPEETTTIIEEKLTSSYIKSTMKLGENYEHFLQKPDDTWNPYGLIGVKNSTLTELALEGQFFFDKSDKSVHDIDINKLRSDLDLTEKSKVIETLNEYLIVHEPVDVSEEVKINLKMIDNDKILIVNCMKVWDVIITEEAIHVIAGKQVIKDYDGVGEVAGTGVEVWTFNYQMSSSVNLGEIFWIAPRGYPNEIIANFVVVDKKIYAASTMLGNKIFELVDGKLIDTEIAFSTDDGYVASNIEVVGNQIYAIKRSGFDDNLSGYLYVWDSEWNVKDKITLPPGVGDDEFYSEGYARERIYSLENKIYIINNQYVVRSANVDADNYLRESGIYSYVINLDSKETTINQPIYPGENNNYILLI